ncbi:mitotic fidelity of chromosome transmission- protein, partial [Teratosphaeriaceae sp. CCFEE 6253]
VEVPTSADMMVEENDDNAVEMEGPEMAEAEDDAPIMLDGLDRDEVEEDVPTTVVAAPSQRTRRFEEVETKTARQSGSSRPSSSASNSSRQQQAASSRKRGRQNIESEHIAASAVESHVVNNQEPQASPSRVEKRNKTRPCAALRVLAEKEELQEEEQNATTVDPSSLNFNATILWDDALPDNAEADDEDPQDAFPSPTPVPELAPKYKRAPKEKAPSRKACAHSTAAKPVASRGSASPSKKRPEGREVSAGPSSTYALRATPPFEDATTRSRFCRNVMKPLQYCANESRIYKHGEIEGIVRANEVSILKRRSNGAATKKGKKVLGKRLDELERRLESIEEEESSSGGAAYLS